jgi:uncharacterized protein
MTLHGIEFDEVKIADFCRRHHIRRLALFGSVLRDDFRPDSDVDVLVEFAAGRTPGLIRLAGMELELSALLGGRKVDQHAALPEPLFPGARRSRGGGSVCRTSLTLDHGTAGGRLGADLPRLVVSSG